ncbi:glycoside hydrolase family 26 protein [Kribbella sp. NPDC049227]|uniref:glycoside hydrolase family 26 protein n=1 Tax=Kribbella sp. NPDC049227 TaxID=3364113 RepID=UPI00371D6119
MIRRLAILLATALLVTPLAAPPATAAATCGPAGDLIPAQGALFGAYAYEGVGDLSQPEALEAKIGHQLRINHNFQPGELPRQRIAADIADGRIPMISFAAGDEVALAQEWDTGALDQRAIDEAEALAGYCVPIFFRFTWEFDLRYVDTDLFKRVWIRVRNIFATRAPNVAFVWNPTWRAFSETNKAVPFYPGDQYVDWIAADGYSRPKPDKPEYNYRSFDSMFRAAHTFAVEHGKPFMVGETGVHRDDTDLTRQADWLDTTRADVKASYPQLKAFLYFHTDGDDTDNHWRVDTPAANPALSSLAGFASDPYFNP